MAEREGFEPSSEVFWTPETVSKRVIARWLAGKLLKTQDAVRLALDGLDTVGGLLG
jgi:hypothetical protein